MSPGKFHELHHSRQFSQLVIEPISQTPDGFGWFEMDFFPEMEEQIWLK